jgi:hypothetical protein
MSRKSRGSEGEGEGKCEREKKRRIRVHEECRPGWDQVEMEGSINYGAASLLH